MQPATYYIRSISYALFLILPLRIASYIIPRSRRQIVMGAWGGNLYSDNPKYLLKYILENTNYKVTWIASREIIPLIPKHPNLTVVEKETKKAIYKLLRARYWICCQSQSFDLTTLPIRGRAICINLWHGIPAKFVGRRCPKNKDRQTDTFLGTLYTSFVTNTEQKQWLVVASDPMAEMLSDGEQIFDREMIIRSGTPRNDFIINNRNNSSLIKALKGKYADQLCFDPTKKIILYLPTFRGEGGNVFAFYDTSIEEQASIRDLLSHQDAILIEKHHYITMLKHPTCNKSLCSIPIPADEQKNVDVQELLLIADILITDYSGVYFDFSLSHKPTIHFAYDMDLYKNTDSGLAFPINDFGAGPIVRSISELKNALIDCLKDPTYLPGKRLHELLTFEKGMASEQIVSFIRNR